MSPSHQISYNPLTKIHVIIPVYKFQYNFLKQFLINLENSLLNTYYSDSGVTIILVFIQEKSNQVNFQTEKSLIKDFLNKITKHYSDRVLNFQVLEFVRGSNEAGQPEKQLPGDLNFVTTKSVTSLEILQYLISSKIFSNQEISHPNKLIFYTDIYTILTEKLLKSIQFNTFKHAQVYFPISFTHFYDKFDAASYFAESQSLKFNNPQSQLIHQIGRDQNDLKILNKQGSFDILNFESCSFYLDDLTEMLKEELSLKNWGQPKDQIDASLGKTNLYDLLRLKISQSQNSKLKIFRAVEAHFVKYWHLLANPDGTSRNPHIIGSRDVVNSHLFEN